MRRTRIAVLSVLSMFSCGDGVMGPTPIPTVNLPPVDVEPAPLPRVDAPFEWGGMAGFTAFALGKPGQDERDVYSLYSAAMGRGFNTGRICSETEFWDGSRSYLPRKPRDAERLRWLLDTIATIPGAQVLLVGDCTLKRQVPLPEAEHWARTVASIAGDFSNIAVETHNEFGNCRGRSDWGGSSEYCPGKEDVRTHIGIYRRAGVQYVTADDGVGPDDFLTGALGFRLANVGAAPADFHPQRTKALGSSAPWDPHRKQIRALYDANGMVLLGETVALGDVTGECTGLRTCDMGRIQKYIDECRVVDDERGGAGCKFVFHSEALLGGEEPGQWPRAR